MGVEPNWGLLGNAPNIGQSFQQGMAMGRQNAIQARSDNALAQIQKNPDDPNALSTLAIYNPQAAQSVIQMKALRRQEAQRAALAGTYDSATGQVDHRAAAAKLAASGDTAGAAELVQQGQAAATARIKFAQAVTNSAIQDFADVTDDASYQRALARNAPRWKAAGLPVPDWLPQHIDESTKEQVLNGIRYHALEVKDQLDQADNPVEEHGGYLFRHGEEKPFAQLPPPNPYMAVPGMGVLPNPAAVSPSGQRYGITYLEGNNAGATPPAQPPAQPGAAAAGAGAPLDPKTFFNEFVLPHEGGYAAHDANGAPVNFGINQSANPGVDVSKLTKEQAAGIFSDKYFKASGAANLPRSLAAMHADTYYINPAAATRILQQSGGDPAQYMSLRRHWMGNLVRSNPAKFGRYEHAWTQRNTDLAAYAAQAGGPTSQAAPAIRATATKDGKTYVQGEDGTWHDTSDEGGDE